MYELYALEESRSEFGHGIELSQIQELAKALSAPASVDEMYSTPGGALTMQSLEMLHASLTLKATDFTLYQDLYKGKAASTVEEYNQLIGHGISDGGFVGQFDNPVWADPDFVRQIALVKFMREGWRVGDVQEATKTTISSRVASQRAALVRLLRNLDRALYNGNSSWVPDSIDGLAKTIAASSSDQIFDLRGGNVTQATFDLAGQLITEGNGNAENSRIYVSPAGVQNLSQILHDGTTAGNNRKIIKSGDNSVIIGGKVDGIMTAFGLMKTRLDKILGIEFESQGVPKYYDQTTTTWTEGATSAMAPTVPSIVLTEQTSVSGSLFASGTVRPSGVTYSYRVCAKNKYGRSIACASVTAGSVAAAGSVTITITPSQTDLGDKRATCFVIYSEKVAGSGVFRYMDTVAANGLSAVAYVDKNLYIPGTARMYIVDQTNEGEDRVMGFSQLLPVHNTDLAKTAPTTQGLISLYGVPKYYKPNVLVELRNIGVTQVNTNLFNTI